MSVSLLITMLVPLLVQDEPTVEFPPNNAAVARNSQQPVKIKDEPRAVAVSKQEPAPAPAGAKKPAAPAVKQKPAPAAVAKEEKPEAKPLLIRIEPENRRESKPLVEKGDDAMPSMGGVAFWTFFVLALMAGVFYIMKRYARGNRYLGAGVIQVLARRPLAQRTEVFLVEVGSKVFLVGATRDRLVTLGEFSDPQEIASLRTRSPERADESIERSFHRSLDEGLREGETAPGVRESARNLIGELKDLRRTVMSWKA